MTGQSVRFTNGRRHSCVTLHDANLFLKEQFFSTLNDSLIITQISKGDVTRFKKNKKPSPILIDLNDSHNFRFQLYI